MKITKTEFIKSASQLSNFYYDGKPQIAIAGKSNVGKSTFINFIANNGKLAKTSNTPGRTRLVNYFNFNDEFILVDLPGYGYAKAEKKEILRWGEMMEAYFQNSSDLKHTILLVDIRHEPTKDDIAFVNYMYYYHLPFTVIATKVDKLNKSEIAKCMQKIITTFKLGKDNIFYVSSYKKQGIEKVMELFDKILNKTDEFIEEE